MTPAQKIAAAVEAVLVEKKPTLLLREWAALRLPPIAVGPTIAGLERLTLEVEERMFPENIGWLYESRAREGKHWYPIMVTEEDARIVLEAVRELLSERGKAALDEALGGGA